MSKRAFVCAVVALVGCNLVGCEGAPVSVEAPFGACLDGSEPVHLADGDVAPITHEPAGDVTVTGVATVGTVDETGQSALEIDAEGTVHRFVIPSPWNPPAFSEGERLTVTFVDEHADGGFRTVLDVDDPVGRPIATYVRALGGEEVDATFAATAARFDIDASAEPACQTDGGACGRRGVRYAIVWSGAHVDRAGGSVQVEPWQLEDDDSAEWSGPETCDAPPRAAIAYDVYAYPALLPAPPACEVAPAAGVGAATSPGGAPAIVHTPEGALDADARVISAVVGESLVLMLDVDGVEHRIEVPGATDEPGLAPDERVHVVLSVDGAARETLVLRAADGDAPLALYTRARSFGSLASSALVGETFDVRVAMQSRCRTATGGQCGRGIVVHELVLGAARVGEGDTRVVPTLRGNLAVSVHALADDGDPWAEGTVCAIGALIADSVDAVVVR
jgi:hypothetical protein